MSYWGDIVTGNLGLVLHELLRRSCDWESRSDIAWVTKTILWLRIQVWYCMSYRGILINVIPSMFTRRQPALMYPHSRTRPVLIPVLVSHYIFSLNRSYFFHSPIVITLNKQYFRSLLPELDEYLSIRLGINLCLATSGLFCANASLRQSCHDCSLSLEPAGSKPCWVKPKTLKWILVAS